MPRQQRCRWLSPCLMPPPPPPLLLLLLRASLKSHARHCLVVLSCCSGKALRLALLEKVIHWLSALLLRQAAVLTLLALDLRPHTHTHTHTYGSSGHRLA